MFRIREFRSGQRLTHDDLNEIRAELARLGKVVAAPPLKVSDDDAGFHFKVDLPEVFTIRILAGGSGGNYPWTRLTPTPSGGWDTDATHSGSLASDPAKETNRNATVPANSIILRAWRDPATGFLWFDRGTCS